MRRLPRVLLGAELWLLALPITILYGMVFWSGLLWISRAAAQSSAWFELIGMLAVLLGGLLVAFSLFSFWRVVYVLYAGGALALSRTSAAWWWIIGVAITYSLCGLLAYITQQVLGGGYSDFYAPFYPGLAGMPVVVPALHLSWIRKHAKTHEALWPTL